MQELIDYIKAENEKRQAWAAEKEGRWASETTTDPEHWKAYGITTIKQYVHYMTVAEYVDMFKAVHGIKPRWMNFDEMTVEEMEAEMRGWSDMWKEQEEQTRKDINRLCDEHNCTEDDLRRWEVI